MKYPISNRIFDDFLKCRHKAYLKLQGRSGVISPFEELRIRLAREYRNRAYKNLTTLHSRNNAVEDTLPFCEIKNQGHDLVLNVTASEDDIFVKFDALKRVSHSPSAHPHYMPITFIHHEKIVKDNKLVLALCGSVLASQQGIVPLFGKILHGDRFATTTVKLSTLIPKAREITRQILDLKLSSHPPPLRLNKHCIVCEFKSECETVAVKQDDLSLLRGLSEREIVKLNIEGIFTVTQYSYTFRPRKTRKRAVKLGLKHCHALNALALRTGTIYVAERPELPLTKPYLFLDVEGIPDKDLYYLIGLLVCDREAKPSYHYWWANNKADEGKIWRSFLAALRTIDKFTLFHYGSYESKYFDQMKHLYGCESSFFDKIHYSAINVLSLIHARVYFPTYSNGLKNIAAYLGFEWTDPNPSGINSLVWRLQWEETRDNDLKNKLILYNQEDCLALETVTKTLERMSTDHVNADRAEARRFVSTDNIRSGFPILYKKNDFFFPEMDLINRCAYFDYQMSRVYLRTSQTLKQGIRKTERKNRRMNRINKEIFLDRPNQCPMCHASSLRKYGRISRVVYDLKLFDGGVKRYVTKFTSSRCICKKCKRTFIPEEIRSRTLSKYGHSLAAWVSYQNITLLKSYGSITEELREIFGYNLTRGIIANIRRKTANYYQPTHEQLLRRMKQGCLIHVDETKIGIKGQYCYVWAFTNLEDTVYVCTDTRKGDFLKEILNEFNGVLVSDFYAAYDSINCAQQKCLIHLVRDMNDDLFKNPFDKEYKEFVHKFAVTLAPIIETVNQYGLKKRYLKKHKPRVHQYIKEIHKLIYTSELAKNYQRRITKYRDKLFTFLDYDGVPWNNNNAENAIKRFARLRRGIDGISTKNGLQRYLVLLSISETLRRRNLSALRFFLSGCSDIDQFWKNQYAA